MRHNRALVFSTDDHLYPAGGAEQAFGNITERLPHITFDLVCARLRRHTARYEVVGNVHIHRVGFGIPKVDGLLLALVGHLYAYRLMKKHSYDFIWSIMASYGAFAAVRVQKKTGIPFLLTLQEGDSFEYIYERVKYIRRQFNEIFAHADGVQAISKYLLAWGKEMGYRGEYGVVIPNGVAIEAFTQTFSQEDIHAMRASFGFPEDACILVTSSRLEQKNGVGDVVEALTLLPENVCFVVCGSGSLEQSIRSRVHERGLGKRVAFLGFVDPKELPKILKASDVFIRPSLSEGLGNAFLEAMAAEILVIGTPVGGIPDFLTDGKTGFVVEKENPESIKKGVDTIMRLNDEMKRKILHDAKVMVCDRYDWDLISREMEDLFNKLTQS